jgi:hypothetical protein
MRSAEHVARTGKDRKVYKVLVRKPEMPLGRPRRGWEYVIKMGVREIGWGMWSGFNWFRIGAGGGLL